VAAATEALELYRAGDPRRFRNRIDPQNELRTAAATSCAVLAVIAAERGDTEQAADLLEQAAGLRAEGGAEIPPLLQDDLDEAFEVVAAVTP
jgi:hypothetical protein